ncbi:MAG: NAD-dependent epimerase/dehydratase family protein [Myxococcales bacterium]|nr:NAD-dependent epimerase/dehydratase family protein [Myxococcales bacterium]
MRFLVTGAGGQVGQDLVKSLRDRGHEVHQSDLRPPDDGARWHRLDVTDGASVEALLAELRPDSVVHLAAILSARGEVDPNLTYRVNQTGTHNLLEACRLRGIGQVIFTSTIAVFGPGLPDPVPDDVPLRPRTMYGVTKVGGELLGGYYHQRYGLDFRGVRFPGLISAVMPGGGTSDYAPLMYVDGLRHGRYEAFCRPDTRIPLMYMPDGVRALLELAEAPAERLRRRVYNVAAFSPTAAEIAESVRRAIPGVDLSFRPDPARQQILDSWPNALDDQAAREDWGWAPRYDLEAMTAELVPALRALLASEAEARSST